MSDTYDDAMTPKTSDDLGLRIDAVQDLIRLLVIAPAGQSDDELPRTPATLLHLSQRLGRLLAQAGMTDCVRAAATLERASADLPSDESLRNIDAVLVYLRARLLNVALPSQALVPGTSARQPAQATNAPTATNETSAETSERRLRPVTRPALTSSGNRNRQTPLTLLALLTLLTLLILSLMSPRWPMLLRSLSVGEGDTYDTVDESQFSTKTQAVIRRFKNATLRQRAPGEIVRATQPPAHEISNEIPEHLKHEFLAEAAGDLVDLRAAIASFGKMPGSLDDLREMALLGHKVKGTADTYLFPVLAKILHCFEDVPRVLQPVAVSHAAACLNLLIRFADVIEAALQEAGDQGEASEDRLVDARFLLKEAQDLAAGICQRSDASGGWHGGHRRASGGLRADLRACL